MGFLGLFIVVVEMGFSLEFLLMVNCRVTDFGEFSSIGFLLWVSVVLDGFWQRQFPAAALGWEVGMV